MNWRREPVTNVEDGSVSSDAKAAMGSDRREWRPRIRYGLPCANCRGYYAANLESCPVCNCTKRMSPFATTAVVADVS